MSKLQLTRPLAFIDIETTGTDRENDRIVEISICILQPNGMRQTFTTRVNPEMPIPEAATAVHGISDADVINCTPFASYALDILDYLHGCDIAGFNSNAFDLPLLYNEFRRCGVEWDYTQFVMVDVGNLFKIQEPRTLSAAVKFYLGRDHDGAHGAEQDINATVDVLLAQLERYPGLPTSLQELALHSNYGRPVLDLSGRFTTDAEGRVLFNFGKWIGQRAADHMDYVEWMYSRGSFAEDTRRICRQLLEGGAA